MKEKPNSTTIKAMKEARRMGENMIREAEANKKADSIPNVTIEDNILRTVEGLIYGARNKTYRHPTENFDNIANLFNAYFEVIKVREGVLELNTTYESTQFKINKIDVAYLNILQKIARGATNQEHLDTIVDIAGYAGCIERMLKNK